MNFERNISRRDFLKLCGMGLATTALRPMSKNLEVESGDIIRIAKTNVSVYSQPWDKSKILYQRFRDEVVNVYDVVVSDKGPGYNPIWYKVWRGYIHSSHTVKVKYTLNAPLSVIPEKGQLAEVSVPWTQSFQYNKFTRRWEQLYRLYNDSTHWITGIEEGPDGESWYKVKDELLEIEYLVPSAHLRPIPASELTPISPEVPPEKKRIEVSISRQTLQAFEGNKIVLDTKISSGLPERQHIEGQISTKTPSGTYNIQNKMPSKHMGDGKITSDIEAYELPGVPWVSFFAPHGVAFHGTFWHTNFGTPMSHGCINMRTEEAKWLFRWATPVYQEGDWERIGLGTVSIVK
jgi:hypothetical protein